MKLKMHKKEKYKNILILGYGKTGSAFARFLCNKKLNIYFWDDNKSVLDKINDSFFVYNQRYHKCTVNKNTKYNNKTI